MKIICYLLFTTLPVQPAQQTKVVPHYIRTVQSTREELTKLLRSNKERTDEDKIKLSRSLRYMHHALHKQLLQEKYEHEQFCKQLKEEKKEVLKLLCKV